MLSAVRIKHLLYQHLYLQVHRERCGLDKDEEWDGGLRKILQPSYTSPFQVAQEMVFLYTKKRNFPLPRTANTLAIRHLSRIMDSSPCNSTLSYWLSFAKIGTFLWQVCFNKSTVSDKTQFLFFSDSLHPSFLPLVGRHTSAVAQKEQCFH